MQIGMVGLGRMGANMVRRVMARGIRCAGFDPSPDAVQAVARDGMTACGSLAGLVDALEPPRAICLMVPVGVVSHVLDELVPMLGAGDAIIDGGNSHYQDDLARFGRLRAIGLHYVDMGTSGGVWGLERGFCLMIGGEPEVVQRLDPFFAALAPGAEAVPPTPGRPDDTAAKGYLHCGPPGAGHFVKMVHNGIEYGIMAAYAEGLNILHHADAGRTDRPVNAETAPLRHPERYRYDLDLGAIADVWRRGSVIASWLLDLTAAAFATDPELGGFEGRVSDSGEGRWTLEAANELSVPAHVLASALFERFASRSEGEFANKVLSAMRFGFGGHVEVKS
jgi:6-phosphogluconate dehydrogenase